MYMDTLRKNLPDLVQASYQPQKVAQQNLEKKGYMLDSQLSSMNTKVFTDKNNTPVILHRGSTTVKDWIDDALLGAGLGKYGHRYKNAVRTTKKVEEKYGKPANTVSHSYGGWLGENSGAKGNILTYNKATGVGDLFKKYGKNQLDVRSQGDIISLPSLTQSVRRETVKNKNKNPLYAHSLKPLYL